MSALEITYSLARILFGIFFVNKLYHSWRCHKLVWAHRVPGNSRRLLHILIMVCMVSAVCMTVGLLTPWMSLILFATYVLLFRYASLFGLEDAVIHLFCFYLILRNTGTHFSIDQLLALQIVYAPLGVGPLPEVVLSILVGCVFLSAGRNKLDSPMWRRGLGAYYFFLLPQFRRADTSFITNSLPVMRFINYAAIVMQLGFLPAILFCYEPLGMIFGVFVLGFAISLSTVFVLTWIGEVLSVALLVMFAFLMSTQHNGVWYVAQSALASTESSGVRAMQAVVGVVLCAAVIVSLVPRVNTSGAISHLYVMCRTLARFAVGLLPLRVFTELHMLGPIVYKTYCETDDDQHEISPLFTEQCRPGRYRVFHPSFFEVLTYKVSEACMEIEKYGHIHNQDRLQFVLQLAQVLYDQYCPQQTTRSIRFDVKQIVAPEHFIGANVDHLHTPWTPAFRVRCENGRCLHVEVIQRKVLAADTGRCLERESFCFAPMGE